MCESISKSISKNVSSQFSRKCIDHAKHFTINWIKAISKRVIQKTTEETGDLIGNKIAVKLQES